MWDFSISCCQQNLPIEGAGGISPFSDCFPYSISAYVPLPYISIGSCSFQKEGEGVCGMVIVAQSMVASGSKIYICNGYHSI